MAKPTEFGALAPDFIRSYHGTSDLLYQGFMQTEPHRIAAAKNFRFELYA